MSQEGGINGLNFTYLQMGYSLKLYPSDPNLWSYLPSLGIQASHYLLPANCYTPLTPWSLRSQRPLTKRWLGSEDYFPVWDANFSAMLNLGCVFSHLSIGKLYRFYATFLWISNISNFFTSRWGAPISPRKSRATYVRFKISQDNNTCRSSSLVHPQISMFFGIRRW